MKTVPHQESWSPHWKEKCWLQRGKRWRLKMAFWADGFSKICPFWEDSNFWSNWVFLSSGLQWSSFLVCREWQALLKEKINNENYSAALPKTLCLTMATWKQPSSCCHRGFSPQARPWITVSWKLQILEFTKSTAKTLNPFSAQTHCWEYKHHTLRQLETIHF